MNNWYYLAAACWGRGETAKAISISQAIVEEDLRSYPEDLDTAREFASFLESLNKPAEPEARDARRS